MAGTGNTGNAHAHASGSHFRRWTRVTGTIKQDNGTWEVSAATATVGGVIRVVLAFVDVTFMLSLEQ